MKNVLFDWGVGAAAAVLIGAGLVAAGASTRAVEAEAATDTGPDPRELMASITSARESVDLASEMKRVSVLRNETLSSVLDRIGAPREEAHAAVYAASQTLDLRSMQAGEAVPAGTETVSAGRLGRWGVSMALGAGTCGFCRCACGCA